MFLIKKNILLVFFLMFYCQSILAQNIIASKAKEYTISSIARLNNVRFEKWVENHLSDEKVNIINSKLERYRWLPASIKLRRTHDLCFKYLFSRYSSRSNFDSVNNAGVYNCLTSSLILHYFIQKQGINSSVHEINNHAYIIIKNHGRDYILESTEKDPLKAIVTNKKTLKKMNDKYDKLIRDYMFQVKNKKMIGTLDIINHDINNEEIIGLYYYNVSASCFNSRNMKKAKYFALKSFYYYPCSRTKLLLDLFKEHQATTDICTK